MVYRPGNENRRDKTKRRGYTRRTPDDDAVFGEIAGAEGEPHEGCEVSRREPSYKQEGKCVDLKEKEKEKKKKTKRQQQTQNSDSITSEARPPCSDLSFVAFSFFFLSQSRSQGEKERKGRQQ